MWIWQKLINELKVVAATTLYFAAWIGVLKVGNQP